MDRTIFGQKTMTCQRARVDRFITPRCVFEERRRRRSLGDDRKTQTVDIWQPNYRQQKKYTSYLDEAFGLAPVKNQEWGTEHQEKNNFQAWPCIPRKKSYLSSADSVLDLPMYSYAAFPELLDWSNDNMLVAALGRHYHKWSWRTQSLTSQGFTFHNINCCKFDPRSELLLLGTDRRTVELHNNASNKKYTSIWCPCSKDQPLESYCSVTALDWSPSGNSFVTGCSRGMIASFCRDTRVISCHHMFRGPVLMVRVSPDARYVAMTTVNSAKILIASWPCLEPISCIYSHWIVKALTWHPWRSALLGIGAVESHLTAGIAMWNAHTEKMETIDFISDKLLLDTMLFSHRTGELVLSLWNSETSYPKPRSHIVVMSDPKTIEDHWSEGHSGLDRVRTMVFSPDGTKLATATADEDLIIWNFLPEDKYRTNTNARRFSALPVYLDSVMFGYSLR